VLPPSSLSRVAMTAETRAARILLAALAVAALAPTLAGCGQKGPLILPGEVTDTDAEASDESTDDEEQNED
jgi:predicted small lipoprotein YifL